MNLLTIYYNLLAVLVLVAAGNTALAQNCGCASNLCCSQHGYCGLGGDYCGQGCQSGPCYQLLSTSAGGAGAAATMQVSDIVTDAFFSGIMKNSPSSNCAGKAFYTRSAFLKALGSYPGFGTTGSNDVAKREIAAFFAHVAHETGGFCYKEEVIGASGSYAQSGGKRVALQLNSYKEGADDRMDPVVSFKTALWFWMKNDGHNAMIDGQGFGATIRATNSVECNGANPSVVSARIRYYLDFCSKLGVHPGTNLSC